ncbi:hypothetical protein JRO89_XS14G0002000 [Xanthoceras sorbifolium]|uniref:SUN domain-containing protein n=1 Tax=Xanthoceras sorbifolium TaxID=99658 RepID=A0ABQ8H2Y9_9ROSI|nr:hypothetical protein JRO89_XS14G0002000 [Xanthoceras sorbifolium]
MSASAVSITANTAARRRPVVVGEKKSNTIELVSTEVQLNGGADRVTSGAPTQSRDLSHHSIRGEAVLDKDLVQVKKSGMANSTVSPRRPRKAAAKPEKPRWMTVASIFTKNLALLLLLLGLVQMIRRLSSGDAMVGTQLGFSEFERRISEVEDFVKSTTGMLQVQVDVVSRKMETEIGGLRNEMSEKIDDKSSALELELKKLEGKSEGMEKLLSELNAASWLSKEEFNKILEELKKGKFGEFSENEVSLDDIRVYAREIVEQEIGKHAADGLGRVDYALASGGGRVVKHSEPFSGGKGTNWFLMSGQNGVHSDADKMLKPSFGEPGQCFPLKGTSGFVQIRLRTAIIPEAITLEHVSKFSDLLTLDAQFEVSHYPFRIPCVKLLVVSHLFSFHCVVFLAFTSLPYAMTEESSTTSGGVIGLPNEESIFGGGSGHSVAFDRSSAPKDCRISGWLQGPDHDLAVNAEKMFLLTEFSYDLEKSNAQTFTISDLPGSGIVNSVRLDFTSNHGSPSHTCIYRLRVHGHEPDSVSVLAMQS